MYKNIIFDFDGTIADTQMVAFNAVTKLSKRFGYKAPNIANIEEYRNMTMREFAKELKVPIRKMPIMIPAYLNIIKKGISSCKPMPGIKPVLEELNTRSNLFILTSNSAENARIFLESNQMKNLFRDVVSESNLFGKHRAIKKLLKKENLILEESVYLGDEIRDIEACRKINISVIAVTWGFNTRAFFEKYGAECIVDKPEELLTILN